MKKEIRDGVQKAHDAVAIDEETKTSWSDRDGTKPAPLSSKNMPQILPELCVCGIGPDSAITLTVRPPTTHTLLFWTEKKQTGVPYSD